MVDGPTVGVLTMSVGCDYFGGILGGIARTAASAGGRMIAIQTLGAGTFDFDPPEPPDFACPVAWEHISGFVVILNSASVPYLKEIRRTGKPIVMISDELAGFSCPVVLPDNKIGVRAAVKHLVEHGHRDIAFAGYLELRDLRERHEAYREALAECGITPRDDLFFDTGDNRESGGARAANAMIAAGMPSTAVVTGNDLNAIGLMGALSAAGYTLPAQQAIVGFDDMDGVVHLTPSLSSVRQRFDSLGILATTLLLRELSGEPVQARTYHVPTSFVARQSCGCPDTLALDAPSPHEHLDVSSPDGLTGRMAEYLAPDPPGIHDRATTTREAGVIVEALRAAADGTPGPDDADQRRALAALHRLNRHPEGLARLMRCVRTLGLQLARDVGVRDGAAAQRVRDTTDGFVTALMQHQSRAQFRDGDDFLNTLKMLYTVCKNLLLSHERDPRRLTWIRDTHALGGCLGLWSPQSKANGAAGRPTLDVVAMFERGRESMPTAMLSMPPQQFPPAELVDLADLAADEMVYVTPLKIGASDWGMLALVGPIEAEVATGREMMNQWAALLTIALDHDQVLTSLREREETMRHAALYDALTGLPNRTLFMERLKQAIAVKQRYPERGFAVLLLDLDGFKLVNDSLGHLAGDRLLIEVADRIQASTRDADVTARFGGDEFAVLLTDVTNADVPVAVADRIRSTLDAPFHLDGEEVVVSSSIGISLGPTTYDLAEDVIRDADTAMYSAKWQRKGSYAIFDVAMHTQAVGRLRTETELRRAVEAKEFELHYQPIVCLDTGRTQAFEALLRWRHPVRGLLSPAEFLPIAEESGMIVPIGRWVVTESCRQISRWRASGLAPQGLRMSVNVSNRQFWNARLIDDLEESLRATDLDPSALIMEINEGVIVNDVRAARARLADLHDMGVQLYIDDFGTGYSSLGALHRLTIDAFKIDQSFVSPLEHDPRSRELVRTIVSMGINLGLQLVAEGIETPEQSDRLREYGCHHGQGHLFSQPIPAERVEAYLGESTAASDRGVRAAQATCSYS